jgi:hypothetical protein
MHIIVDGDHSRSILLTHIKPMSRYDTDSYTYPTPPVLRRVTLDYYDLRGAVLKHSLAPISQLVFVFPAPKYKRVVMVPLSFLFFV